MRKTLACGCVLGWERCIDCRPGLHPDQEKALEISLKQMEEALEREPKHFADDVGTVQVSGGDK